MPNWTENQLVISGTEANVEAFLEEIASETLAFDFHKLLPIPEELNDVSCGYNTIDGVKFERWRGDVGGKDEVGVSEEERQQLVDKYGADCSLDWQCNNWGTKWGADNVQVRKIVNMDMNWENGDEAQAELTFCTPWRAPYELVEHIVNSQNKGLLSPVGMYWLCQNEDDGYKTTYKVAHTQVNK